MIPILLALSTIIAIGTFVYLVLATPETLSRPKSKAGDDVEQDMLDYAASSVEGRADKMLFQKSLYERIVNRLLRQCIAFGRRFTPQHYVEVCAAKLRHAGKRGPEELDRFLAIRLVSAVVGVGLLIITVLIARDVIVLPRMFLALVGLATLFALVGPDAWLNRSAAGRQELVQTSLPDVLDLLTISVEAGVGFEQAIGHVTEMMDGPLPEEFGRMNAEMRAGASRAEALRALDERVGVEDVRSFIMAILQADKFGVSIARILRAQSDEVRTKRRQRAQECAQKAPVKMLVPITLFIFPPLFIVLLGPAMLNIATSLK